MRDDQTQRRIAANEIRFREANEKIREAAVGTEVDPVPFLCECADPACTQIVLLTLDRYRSIRANPRLFFDVRGHHLEAIAAGAAVVVEEHDGFVLVEKVGAAADAAQTAARGADGEAG